VQVSCSEGGNITPNGLISVVSGDKLIFEIIPNERFVLSSLMLDDQTLPAQRTYVLDHITNNHELFANFTAETMYTLTSTADTGGQIAPFGNIEKKENELQVYQISPDDHHAIANVYIDDMAMGKMSSIAVKADANHRIHASFESIEAYSIQVHIRAQDTLNPLVAYWVELWKDEVFVKGVYAKTRSVPALLLSTRSWEIIHGKKCNMLYSNPFSGEARNFSNH